MDLATITIYHFHGPCVHSPAVFLLTFTGEGLPRTCLHHRKGKDLDLPIKRILCLLPSIYY